MCAGAIVAACSPADAAPQLAPSDGVRSTCEAVPVVALLLDKSRSAPTSLVFQLTVADSGAAARALPGTCGGELAVGAIRERASTPMIRLFVETPPRPPAREAIPASGNPMILREQRVRADRVYSERLTAFEAQARRRAAAADVAIGSFRRDVRAVIEEPTRAPATDIWAALRQADLFLNETHDVRAKPGAATPPVRRVLVALTDGIHTTAGRAYRLESRPDFFVVNSSGEVGVLAAMHPRRFESFAPVTRIIAGPSLVTH